MVTSSGKTEGSLFDFVPPEDQLIAREIGNQSDRGAAIVASAAIEDELEMALEKRLIIDPGPLKNSLFGGYGPLASFGAKIDLGRAVGLYSSDALNDLHTIRKIRNEFAHIRHPRDFNDQRIRALCMNLRGVLFL
jgi:hypothetical protein